MSSGEIHDQKPVSRELLVQRSANGSADVLAGSLSDATICSANGNRDSTLESTASEFCEAADTLLPPVISVDAANLIRVLQLLEAIAKRQAPRIAIKAKGKILFFDIGEIVAVEAEGNYISLRLRTNPYLLRESLSSMAEKLKPYGFVRIHRSVVVNTSAVAEIEPLPTGEYRLRLKCGMEYIASRTYKDSLKNLAQLWVHPAGPCG